MDLRCTYRLFLGEGIYWVFSTHANQPLCQLQLSLSCRVFLGFGRSLFTIVVSSFFQMFLQKSGYHIFTMCVYLCVLLFVFWLFVYTSVIYSIWTDMQINNKQFSSPAVCVCVSLRFYNFISYGFVLLGFPWEHITSNSLSFACWKNKT